MSDSIKRVYIENLEEQIIDCLADKLGCSYRKAMDIFFKSKLSSQIERCEYGIENMDYRYLVEDLLENESELVSSILGV